MLSIGVMKTAGWEYYAREVADGLEDYYTGAGEAPGVWTGAGATAAGITGTVSAEALGLAFGEARHPGTGEQLGRRWRPDGVIGFDATFSAPKSVSLVFALGDREVRAQVRAAHVTAVEDAGLAYLEDHAAFTRRGRNGVMITDTEGLVIARFEHRTSRALDPQLHSHCLILNKVRDAQDGSWRALHGRALFEEAKTAGMLYQAGLRAELTRRLGVVWGPVSEHGQAELAGIPHQLLARFSTRTVEVEAAAEAKIAELERALGRSLEADERGRVYRLAVLATRRPKTHDHVSEVGLYERWASEARDAGWEPGAVVQAAIGTQRSWCTPHTGTRGQRRRARVVRRAGDVHPPRRRASGHPPRRSCRRRRRGPGGCTRRADRRCRAGRCRWWSVCSHPNAVEAPPSLVRRDGGSVWDAPEAARYTTREMLAVEGRILHAAQIGRAAGIGRITPETLDRAIADERHPARYRPARRGTGRHEPGPPARGRDRSRRHRQDHHAARRRERLGQRRLPGDRPEPHRGSCRNAALRSRHARRRPSPSSSTGTTTSGRPPAGRSLPATSSSSTKPACSRPETSIASSISSPATAPNSSWSATTSNSAPSAPPAACSPPSPTPSALSSSTRRIASPTGGKPTPSPSCVAVPIPASRRLPGTAVFTAALNLKRTVTVSPAGGPLTRPGVTRSCSPTITPPPTGSPPTHARPVSSPAKSRRAASACTPRPGRRRSASAITSKPAATTADSPTAPTNGSTTTTAGTWSPSTSAAGPSTSSTSATRSDHPGRRLRRAPRPLGVRHHHRRRPRPHRRRNPRHRHPRHVSQRALHRPQPRPRHQPRICDLRTRHPPMPTATAQHHRHPPKSSLAWPNENGPTGPPTASSAAR